LRFGGAKYIFRGRDIRFYYIFKTIFSENKKIWEGTKDVWRGTAPKSPPRGYGPDSAENSIHPNNKQKPEITNENTRKITCQYGQPG